MSIKLPGYETRCPSCHAVITFGEDRLGDLIECPNCSHSLTLTGAELVDTPPVPLGTVKNEPTNKARVWLADGEHPNVGAPASSRPGSATCEQLNETSYRYRSNPGSTRH